MGELEQMRATCKAHRDALNKGSLNLDVLIAELHQLRGEYKALTECHGREALEQELRQKTVEYEVLLNQVTRMRIERDEMEARCREIQQKHVADDWKLTSLSEEVCAKNALLQTAHHDITCAAVANEAMLEKWQDDMASSMADGMKMQSPTALSPGRRHELEQELMAARASLAAKRGSEQELHAAQSAIHGLRHELKAALTESVTFREELKIATQESSFNASAASEAAFQVQEQQRALVAKASEAAVNSSSVVCLQTQLANSHAALARLEEHVASRAGSSTQWTRPGSCMLPGGVPSGNPGPSQSVLQQPYASTPAVMPHAAPTGMAGSAYPPDWRQYYTPAPLMGVQSGPHASPPVASPPLLLSPGATATHTDHSMPVSAFNGDKMSNNRPWAHPAPPLYAALVDTLPHVHPVVPVRVEPHMHLLSTGIQQIKQESANQRHIDRKRPVLP